MVQQGLAILDPLNSLCDLKHSTEKSMTWGPGLYIRHWALAPLCVLYCHSPWGTEKVHLAATKQGRKHIIASQSCLFPCT